MYCNKIITYYVYYYTLFILYLLYMLFNIVYNDFESALKNLSQHLFKRSKRGLNFRWHSCAAFLSTENLALFLNFFNKDLLVKIQSIQFDLLSIQFDF